jgi:hypothetical protein
VRVVTFSHGMGRYEDKEKSGSAESPEELEA